VLGHAAESWQARTAVLRRLFSFLDRRTLPVGEWLREGAPHAPLIVLFALLPAFLAAPLRVVTGVAMDIALVFGILVTVAIVIPLRPALARKGGGLGVVYAAMVLLSAFSVLLLYNGDFSGLPGYQDTTGNVAIDGAVHSLLVHRFARTDPNEYLGFVSLYAFWSALFHFVSQVAAANLSYQLGVVLVAAAPLVIAPSLLGKRGRTAFLVGVGVCFAAGLAVGYRVLLPLQAFHLAGGFWPHLFALIPLLAIWWVDTLVRPRFVRILSVLGLTLLYRYTYGLNLADLLLAVGALFAIEAAGKELTRAGRIAAGLIALAALGASHYAYGRLIATVTQNTGWIVPHDMALVWRGQLTVVAALAVTIGWCARLEKGSGIARALRFPALFAVANATLMEAFKHEPGGERAYATLWSYYYFQKYSLHAVVLIAGAGIVALGFWSALLVAKRSRGLVAGAVIAAILLVAGQQQIHEAIAPYRGAFDELAFGKAPYPHLRPWVDAEALQRIRSTLRTNRAEHGGFLARYYPLAAFMNATFVHGSLPFWNQQPVETSAGHCVFWEGGAVGVLDRDPQRSCESYPAKWEGGERTICSRCF
jgi:hypothetical protein